MTDGPGFSMRTVGAVSLANCVARHSEPFSSRLSLADLQNVDGLGELPGAIGSSAAW